MFYRQIFSAFGRRQVRYAVAGGVAVNLHGIPRMTADLDLVVDLQAENLKRFIETMEALGFQPRLPVAAADLLEPGKRKEWIENKHMRAFTFWNKQRPFEEIDLLLQGSEIPGILDRAVNLPLEESHVSLVALDDLIEMKKLAGRAQDLADLEALEKLQAKSRG